MSYRYLVGYHEGYEVIKTKKQLVGKEQASLIIGRKAMWYAPLTLFEYARLKIKGFFKK